ncbi:MAG: type III secretion inner membrane ring lipoprotein SctJ [Chlamydiales bacterium]|nr:type III secretion inner membrane ring lipoprotein SctJ [Chlamydiales bacterium]
MMLFLLVGCAGQEIIAHDLDEREANEILVFLEGRGIDATKEAAAAEGAGGGGGAAKWNISVPEAKRSEAMSILSQAGLPRRQGQNLLDLFKESGLVPSEIQQQIRYQSGLAEQIASIIRKMDGVIDAEVQLSFPKEDVLNPNAKKGQVTASVYVKHTGVLSDPNSHLISSIKWLVAGAVPELNFDNVTVVPDLARYRDAPVTGGRGDDSMRSGDKPLVSVWTIILAKESVTRFRVIFFSFFVSILVLLTLFLLLLWKVLPILHAAGPNARLISLKRIDVASLTKKEEPPPAAAEEKAKKEKKKDDDDDDDDDDEE